jgi:hypothetical protein
VHTTERVKAFSNFTFKLRKDHEHFRFLLGTSVKRVCGYRKEMEGGLSLASMKIRIELAPSDAYELSTSEISWRKQRRLSRWLFIDADSVDGCLHREYMGNSADISHVLDYLH